MADPRSELNSVVKFQKLEKCFNCQSDLSNERFCYVCKEISPSSSFSSVPPVERETEHFHLGFGDVLENGMFLVDSASKLLPYEPLCCQAGQYFQLYPSTTDVIFKQPEEKVSSWLESSPSESLIVDVGQVESSVSSDEEYGGCATCGQASDTCVMHVSSRHLDFCYTCASYCFQAGAICPLCQQRIVYIYMYKDTYLLPIHN